MCHYTQSKWVSVSSGCLQLLHTQAFNPSYEHLLSEVHFFHTVSPAKIFFFQNLKDFMTGGNENHQQQKCSNFYSITCSTSTCEAVFKVIYK